MQSLRWSSIPSAQAPVRKKACSFRISRGGRNQIDAIVPEVINAVESQLSLTSVASLQLGILRLRFFQQREVGVGIFPEREEILVSGERPSAGGIGVRALRSSRL